MASNAHDQRYAHLRQQAERALTRDMNAPIQYSSIEEMRELLHELHVHQVELQLQNEELLRARRARRGRTGSLCGAL